MPGFGPGWADTLAATAASLVLLAGMVVLVVLGIVSWATRAFLTSSDEASGD